MGFLGREDQELLRLVKREQLSFEERVVLLLALMPHLCPQLLDIFFINNKDLEPTLYGIWRVERIVAWGIFTDRRDGGFYFGGE